MNDAPGVGGGEAVCNLSRMVNLAHTAHAKLRTNAGNDQVLFLNLAPVLLLRRGHDAQFGHKSADRTFNMHHCACGHLLH